MIEYSYDIYLRKVYEKVCGYSRADIENAVVRYFVEKLGYSDDAVYSERVSMCIRGAKREVVDVFYKLDFPVDFNVLIKFLEYIISNDVKGENGIVFTPKYISDFIVRDCLRGIDEWKSVYRVLDPSCGCGIFLVSAIEYIHNTYKIDIPTIINNHIYGIDILLSNVNRCKWVLELYCLYHKVPSADLRFNLVCGDSLKSEWDTLFSVPSFDFIIGNPPYVNPHSLNGDTAKYLKEIFYTTKTGVFNIFYAFIEHSVNYVSNDGFVEFIVPNNFLTIKSADRLRYFLQSGKHIKSILDFTDNMVFRPVRTYNCIIKLVKKNKDQYFMYQNIAKTGDIESALHNIRYKKMEFKNLDPKSWVMACDKTKANIKAIERFDIDLKEFIRSGIATLRDGVYLVSKDNGSFFKKVDGKYYEIDNEIVKPIYKIPELKSRCDTKEVAQYIIFPYQQGKSGYELISEEEMRDVYQNTYKYLCAMRYLLDARDKGKGQYANWYAYGRTQGLNKYGRKLMFPTFSSKPNFIYIDDENALFCNGYAVFENDFLPLNVMERVLNSAVMDYYVKNTSYSIEGGFYCYQKKYIERFSLPYFSDTEIDNLSRYDKNECDRFLLDKYQISV